MPCSGREAMACVCDIKGLLRTRRPPPATPPVRTTSDHSTPFPSGRRRPRQARRDLMRLKDAGFRQPGLRRVFEAELVTGLVVGEGLAVAAPADHGLERLVGVVLGHVVLELVAEPPR